MTVIEDEIAEDMHKLAILEHYREGGAIERKRHFGEIQWEPIRNGNFDFVNYQYRKLKA